VKVVLGGSRQLSFIPEEVMDNLNSWMREGVEFFNFLRTRNDAG
jgi:hypothetical protein